jgi:hypothetical protein
MGNLQSVDAKELGEVIDMIKDLEEAIYYCTIVEAMEGNKEKEKHIETQRYYRDMERPMGRMYYGDGAGGGSSPSGGNGGNSGGSRMYREYDYHPYDMRDSREGRSPMSRKMYMETKEMHHDKSKQIQELEKYMNELSNDIIEMIEDAEPEERQILQKKL